MFSSPVFEPVADEAQLIHRYASLARPIILTYFKADSCIASTAITIGVLDALGYKAEPLTCGAMVFNRAFMDMSERKGRIPQGEAEIRAWFDECGAWSVGIGYHAERGKAAPGFDGHLVAIFGSWLIDASINQADRPNRGITLPPVLAVRTPRHFRRGREKLVLRGADGITVRYEARPKERGYEKSPDWHDKSRHTRAISEILAVL